MIARRGAGALRLRSLGVHGLGVHSLFVLCLAAAALAGCPSALPPTSVLCERARAALDSGDTVALFNVARDVYRRHGAEFDTGLVLEVMRPDTLSSYYREDGNRIVLASGAQPGAWPGQLRALSVALRYADADGFPAGLTTEAAARFVNVLVLLIAAHEEAHYLRAQYFSPPQDGDHFESERAANELGVAVVRHLADADPQLARELGAARSLLDRLVAESSPAVRDYPAPGADARQWFNANYGLLLRHEPGVYLSFQMRWWLEFLSAPSAPLGALVEQRVLRSASDYLAGVRTSRRLTVAVESTQTAARRLPSEVLAVGPRGELLIDGDGRLLLHDGAQTRRYAARGLPYGEGYRSNYATWPSGQRLYAFRWQAPETLILHTIDLDDLREEATTRELARLRVPERVVTLSHDPAGALYALADGGEEWLIYKLAPERAQVELWRRIPRRPHGHADGAIADATFEFGAFTVLGDGSLVFADPSSFALRRLDESGYLTTLFGTLRGRRDGPGERARTSHPSHLAAHAKGLYFVESGDHQLLVRDARVRPRWRSR